MTVDLDKLYEYVMASEEIQKYNAWRLFDPYSKQREFMALGAKFPERLLTAGNQTGKTKCGGYETGCHLTGVYPEWWKGLRFDQNTGPCEVWVGGTAGVAVRDGPQKQLFGEPGVADLFGTGFIPRDAIEGDPSSSRAATSAIDTAHIRHSSGGLSSVGFKTYEQDRRHWQGPTKKFLWFDEEPPLDIYTEGLARLAATGGSHILTFTPLFGYSDVVKRFLEETNSRRAHIQMALTDARHMTAELIEATLSIYPRHEWAARRDGDPHLSGGLVFGVPPEDLEENPWSMGSGQTGFQLPANWPLLWAVDFTHSGSNISHPFAAVLGAIEPPGIGHILATIKTLEGLPLIHAQRMKDIAANVPVAWPHDGNVADMKGEPLAQLYRKLGLNMLAEHATFLEGGYSTEGGITALDLAMRSGHFKVNKLCQDWFQEMRTYHRKKDPEHPDQDGKLVKINDDLMSATRIFWMARRFARCVPLGAKMRVPLRRRGAQDINPWTGRPV
jgi:phage terminase large subunit-like protein